MVHFNVPDMTCGTCAQRIGRAVEQVQLPGDVEVKIDVAARQVRITAQAGESAVELVRSAIERAGYKAEAAVSPSSRQTTGGCCCASRSITSVDVDQDGAKHASSCCG